ncbi:MAG: glycosyl hydrolase 115 family protein [Gemmatimonadaceae bacterium]|nr:glycosyl hydrolase 115 family protein [Chitinophagaceae bacterium]
MKICKPALTFLLLLISFFAFSQKEKIQISRSGTGATFRVVEATKTAGILYDSTEAKVVGIAARALSQDIALITSRVSQINNAVSSNQDIILIGTLGKSRYIDSLTKLGLIASTAMKGKWENFGISILPAEPGRNQRTLVIFGSDARGTAFGVFELSKILGVSPWSWWADVHPKKSLNLYLKGAETMAGTPSVKYRGIFINDEDWGLQPWAAKTFEPETGDIGPKTYAKVFELLLRLKANLIWPAMHPSTKAFFHYPLNKDTAAAYDIIVGSSHAEPMLRNNVGEWRKETMGEFNYLTNQQSVFDYWEKRVAESKSTKAIYSLGMRGVHDSGLEGIKDPKDAVPLVERIFNDQRKMLEKHINDDVSDVPQAFTLYKEVLDIYDRGLTVPDDVILVWPDDNYGYIQRLSDEKEKKRKGGSGVYYHASYWGRPHDYLWLSTTSPGLIRHEMMKAYNSGADKLWVLNVGDIKPLEHNIDLFLSMAYDVKPFVSDNGAKSQLNRWCGSIFGKENARGVANLLSRYYELAFERRPEFMGWSQTEPTTKTNFTAYNHFSYGDQAKKRLDAYDSLTSEMYELQKKILKSQPQLSDAFYQLVFYPVAGSALMNRKFLLRDKAYLYAKQGRISASEYFNKSLLAFDSIVSLTKRYNELSGGKWNGIMNYQPRELPVYLKPVLVADKSEHSGQWSISPEGADTLTEEKDFNLKFSRTHKQSRFTDIFLQEEINLNWRIDAPVWVKISKSAGTLDSRRSEERVWVSVDWTKLPAKDEVTGEIVFEGGGRLVKLAVAIDNRQWNLPAKVFVERDQLISIFAANFSSRKSATVSQWKTGADIGFGRKSLQSTLYSGDIGIANTDSIKTFNDFVSYDFHSASLSEPQVIVYSLPTHPISIKYSMRYGVSIDDGDISVIDFKTFGRSDEWKHNVLSNTAIKKARPQSLQPGRHSLKIYAIDPGVVLDRIVIDFGGFKPSYGTIPESFR